jgi:hypothetical protein
MRGRIAYVARVGVEINFRQIHFYVLTRPSALADYPECPTCGGPVVKALVVCNDLDDDPEWPSAANAIWCIKCFHAIFNRWLAAQVELERVLAQPDLELVKS